MAMVPSDVLMPDHRLEHLLRQSLRYQQDASLFPYTHSTRLSLTDDLAFDEAKLPTPKFRSSALGSTHAAASTLDEQTPGADC